MKILGWVLIKEDEYMKLKQKRKTHINHLKKHKKRLENDCFKYREKLRKIKELTGH